MSYVRRHRYALYRYALGKLEVPAGSSTFLTNYTEYVSGQKKITKTVEARGISQERHIAPFGNISTAQRYIIQISGLAVTTGLSESGLSEANLGWDQLSVVATPAATNNKGFHPAQAVIKKFSSQTSETGTSKVTTMPYKFKPGKGFVLPFGQGESAFYFPACTFLKSTALQNACGITFKPERLGKR